MTDRATRPDLPWPSACMIWLTRRTGPGAVALVWAIYLTLIALDLMLFPGEDYRSATAYLYLAGTPVFAAFLAGWALRWRDGALRFARALCLLGILLEICAIPLKFWAAWSNEANARWLVVPFILGWLAIILIMWNGARRQRPLRRIAAVLLVIAANGVAASFSSADDFILQAAGEARAALLPAPPPEPPSGFDTMREIPADRLWNAQQALLAKEANALQDRQTGRENIYALAVAADGTQNIFSREAKAALGMAASRYGRDYRGGILVSNGAADLMVRPLATEAHVAAALRAIGQRIDPARDIVFIYLASHGGRDATLATGLPDYQDLAPISSAGLARALDEAGIRRRVVIVSACYGASWFSRLATADSIVIGAAAKDRTSFGCDDQRDLTFFGEALLKGPLAKGDSLRNGFEAARSTVARWEREVQATPSLPQVHVGERMRPFYERRAAIPRSGSTA